MARPKEPCWTIYCHTHVESGRRYIGVTKHDWIRRWHQHCAQAKKLRTHFANAIRKYGKDAFSHEVLWVFYDLDSANAGEEWLINHFDTIRNGFNSVKGGGHQPHPGRRNPWNRPEYRKKISAVLRSLNAATTTEERSARTKVLWGDHEYRTTVSAASTEMWSSEKHRAKVSWQWLDYELRGKRLSGLYRGAAMNAAKTHCPSGHEYTSDNTKLNAKGSRLCVVCYRVSRKNSASRKRSSPR